MTARILMWYGFLGGAAAWSLQLVVGSQIEESGCSHSSDTKSWIVTTTLFLGAAAATSVLAAFFTWRGIGRDARGAVGFLAVTGMLAGAFFLVLIALGGLQLLSLDSCSQG